MCAYSHPTRRAQHVCAYSHPTRTAAEPRLASFRGRCVCGENYWRWAVRCRCSIEVTRVRSCAGLPPHPTQASVPEVMGRKRPQARAGGDPGAKAWHRSTIAVSLVSLAGGWNEPHTPHIRFKLSILSLAVSESTDTVLPTLIVPLPSTLARRDLTHTPTLAHPHPPSRIQLSCRWPCLNSLPSGRAIYQVSE